MVNVNYNYLIREPTLATVDVSSDASTSSIIYSGEGKLSCIARIKDKEQAACCPPDSILT